MEFCIRIKILYSNSHGLYSSVAESDGKISLSSLPSSLSFPSQRPCWKYHFLPSDGESISTRSRNHDPPAPELSWPILKAQSRSMILLYWRYSKKHKFFRQICDFAYSHGLVHFCVYVCVCLLLSLPWVAS